MIIKMTIISCHQIAYRKVCKSKGESKNYKDKVTWFNNCSGMMFAKCLATRILEDQERCKGEYGIEAEPGNANNNYLGTVWGRSFRKRE